MIRREMTGIKQDLFQRGHLMHWIAPKIRFQSIDIIVINMSDKMIGRISF